MEPTEGQVKEFWYSEADLLEAKREGIRQAIGVYDPYIKGLEDENGSLIGLAYVHGWRSSQVKFGEKCRKDIKALKALAGKPS